MQTQICSVEQVSLGHTLRFTFILPCFQHCSKAFAVLRQGSKLKRQHESRKEVMKDSEENELSLRCALLSLRCALP